MSKLLEKALADLAQALIYAEHFPAGYANDIVQRVISMVDRYKKIIEESM